jgi:hypothetical protein
MNDLAEKVASVLTEEFGLDASASEIEKSNGVLKPAVTIVSGNIGAIHYLENYAGSTDTEWNDDDAREIARTIAEVNEDVPKPDFSVDSCNPNKHPIFYKLLNYEKNKKFECALSERLFDLILVPYVLVNASDEGVSSYRLTDEIIERSSVDCGKEAREAIKENTRTLFGSIVRSDIVTAIENLTSGIEIPDEGQKLFVLSNAHGMFGAASVVLSDAIDDLARERDSDLWVMPSSIHEILAIAMSDCTMNADEMRALVKDVNAACVNSEDFLSDSIYAYRLKDKKLEVVE